MVTVQRHPTAVGPLAGVRIGLIVYGDLEERTGGNIYDQELLRGLAALGATTTVLTLRERRAPSGDGESVDTLLARLDPWRFDVLLQDELCHAVLNVINASLGARDRPLRIAIVHNLGYTIATGEDATRGKQSEREFLRGVHGCVVNSTFTQREVEALVGHAIPSIVAYPSVGPDLGRGGGNGPRAVANGRPVRVLSVANLSAVKGVHYLLDALAAVRRHPWTLELVGSTERDARYAQSIEEQIDTLGLAERIQMSGEFRGSALRAAYERADVMVLASPQEGFGIACLEAMRCGCPVIASSDGAARELVGHEGHGLLVDPTDHMAFVATLTRAFSEPERMHAMGAAAHRRAMEHPTWATAAARVAAFVRERQSASRA